MSNNTGPAVLERSKGKTHPDRASGRAQQNLPPEQAVVLRLLKEGQSFSQIRHYLFEIEGSETRASETSRMIEYLTEQGYLDVA